MLDPRQLTRSIIVFHAISSSHLYVSISGKQVVCRGESYFDSVVGHCVDCNASCVSGCPSGFAVKMTCSRSSDCSCVQCPEGTYSFENFPSTHCLSCKEREMHAPRGTIVKGCGGTSEGTLERCGNLKPLHYFSKPGSCEQRECTLSAPKDHFLASSCSDTLLMRSMSGAALVGRMRMR